MPLYAATIFVSAFLLFLVQPVMAKQILPWFGGSAAVWTTCLVFFQTALLAGYAYSDYRRAPARRAHAGQAAHGAADRIGRGAADRSRRVLEADRRRESVVADPRPAGGDDRAAVLPAVDDEPAGPGLVRARPARREPVSAVRAVEPRVDAGAGRLPVPARAVGADARAGDRLVGRLRGVRRTVRRRRVGEPAAALPRSAPRPRKPATRRADAVPDEPPPTVGRQILVVRARRDRVAAAARGRPTTSRRTSPPCRCSGSLPLAIYLLTFILCFDGKGWYRRDTFLAMLAAGLGVMAWTLADPKLTHELATPDRRLLRRAVSRLHVLPRRARAAEAGADAT